MVSSSSLEDIHVGLAAEEDTEKIISVLNVIIDRQFLRFLGTVVVLFCLPFIFELYNNRYLNI